MSVQQSFSRLVYFLVLVVLMLLGGIFCRFNDTSYRASVAILHNRPYVSEFVSLIGDAKDQDSEILVFPELSVFMAVPERVLVGLIPCINDSARAETPTQFDLSCAARSNRIYVALSIYEHGETCKEGSKGCWLGYYMYNTEVVFDRDGRIITKYRKAHVNMMRLIFMEGDGLPVPVKTDFGVTFGQFICHDILYSTPSTNYVDDLGITDIIYTTDWYDYIPATSLAIQSGWSRLYDVNFLAANNEVEKGGYTSLGGGIFSNGEPLVWTREIKNQVISADVPKKKKRVLSETNSWPFVPTRSPQSELTPIFHIHNKTFILTSSAGESGSLTLEIDELACDFSYRVSESSMVREYFFLAVATYVVMDSACVEFCGIVNCGTTMDSCSLDEPFDNRNAKTVFEELSVVARLKDPYVKKRMIPLIGTDEMNLFDPLLQYETTRSENRTVFGIHSSKDVPQSQPLLFAGHLGTWEGVIP